MEKPNRELFAVSIILTSNLRIGITVLLSSTVATCYVAVFETSMALGNLAYPSNIGTINQLSSPLRVSGHNTSFVTDSIGEDGGCNLSIS